MADETQAPVPEAAPIPEAVERKRHRSLQTVWIIPIIAAIVGGWIAF